ncbi:hypothetical protein CIHG_06248, partial [Coccidioides immitis H538.4]
MKDPIVGRRIRSREPSTRLESTACAVSLKTFGCIKYLLRQGRKTTQPEFWGGSIGLSRRLPSTIPKELNTPNLAKSQNRPEIGSRGSLGELERARDKWLGYLGL